MDAMKCLLTRRSVRAFTPTQITDSQLHDVLQAAVYAPNAMGKQSPYYVAVQDKDCIEILSKMNAAVAGTDKDMFYGAPTVILAFAQKDFAPSRDDTALGMGNMCNAAHALGLGACWINRAREMFDTDEGKALLAQWGLPQNLMGVGCCILGYPQGELPAAKERRGDNIVIIR